MAVVSQPCNRGARIPQPGRLDASLGEFWVDNPWDIIRHGHNLSCFERDRAYLNVRGQNFVEYLLRIAIAANGAQNFSQRLQSVSPAGAQRQSAPQAVFRGLELIKLPLALSQILPELRIIGLTANGLVEEHERIAIAILGAERHPEQLAHNRRIGK